MNIIYGNKYMYCNNGSKYIYGSNIYIYIYRFEFATRALFAEVLTTSQSITILHFSGHGKDGNLLFETHNATIEIINEQTLMRLMNTANSLPLLVILASCESDKVILMFSFLFPPYISIPSNIYI